LGEVELKCADGGEGLADGVAAHLHRLAQAVRDVLGIRGAGGLYCQMNRPVAASSANTWLRGSQALDIRRIDLIKRAVTPGRWCSAVMRPIGASGAFEGLALDAARGGEE
jgi:hypothetical protein